MGIECLKMFLIYQKIFKVTVVSFIRRCFGGGSYYIKKLSLKVMGISHIKMFHRILFAVSPEIVPAPESHRSVALLISSQSRITFGRSFSCQGTREKTSLKG